MLYNIVYNIIIYNVLFNIVNSIIVVHPDKLRVNQSCKSPHPRDLSRDLFYTSVAKVAWLGHVKKSNHNLPETTEMFAINRKEVIPP
jgi:hypothetical protein